MMRPALFLAMVMAGPIPATAQQVPGTDRNDGRIRQIDYVPNRVFTVMAAQGYQLTINLAPGEHIQTVALGDTNAFQVTANRSGNSLFVKALQPNAITNMTVATDARQYAFTLTAAPAGQAPVAYTIAFRYPRAAVAPPPAVVTQVGAYKLGGSKLLWPSRISDDGEHVFIDWPANVDLPAIYAIDGQGRESLTNGMMRGDHMVVDGIAPRLVFRIDREMATATRYLPKAVKP